ncbi:calcium and integrin-binding family member 2 [Eurytemora carolleeae]|uniref:calcium and integrin-binding family member 2 n=1 Tax=Eurytemora carolleeae TaxID=1294199 RepID=UPI000C778A09|nr:calcium and integrin-binding family member 2 [Eurytemora carolleeae]|eukprot:XP_023321058.1 calcium and integrin-binding family member 2-like [Eurytemora affinis]
MGNKQTIFTDEEIENYLDTTFLNRKEFLRILRRFLELQPGYKKGILQNVLFFITISFTMSKTFLYRKYVSMHQENTFRKKSNRICLDISELSRCPELRENPFRKRICKVFSKDGSGNLEFNEFVQMFSCLCENSPRELKLHYAFSIYDIDGDGYISKQDIQQVVQLVSQGELNSTELEAVCRQVLEESDFDDDEQLSKNEFTHIVDKSPDFFTTFNIRI